MIGDKKQKWALFVAATAITRGRVIHEIVFGLITEMARISPREFECAVETERLRG